MTNKMQIFKYNDNEVRTVQINGEPWWVLKDVCDVLELSNPTAVADRLDDDEKSKVDPKSDLGSRSNTPITVINESGLYNVIIRSDKPEARNFRRWVTHEVLPSIRKTGSYTTKPITDYQRMTAETKDKNARVRTALIYERLAAQHTGTYKQILQAYVTKELAGEFILPLPESLERTYSATEIGEMLGVSANRIGRLANTNGLKIDEYGKYVHDKSRYSAKEVENFYYNEKAIEVFRELLQQVTA